MFLLVLGWGIFYFLHSWLAATSVKNRLVKVLPALTGNRYRLFYNGVALITSVPLLLLHVQTPSPLLFETSGITTAVGVVGLIAGAVLLKQAAKQYNLKAFAGLEPEGHLHLNTGGPNRYMRHPLYSGTLLLLLGYFLMAPAIKNGFLLLITFLYVLIGIWLEEQKLVQQYGSAYTAYQKKVKKLIPYIF